MTGARGSIQLRLANLVGCCLAAVTAASTSFAADIVSARYTDQTSRYQHGILGDTVEYGAIEVTLSDGSRVSLTLPETRVFF